MVIELLKYQIRFWKFENNSLEWDFVVMVLEIWDEWHCYDLHIFIQIGSILHEIYAWKTPKEEEGTF